MAWALTIPSYACRYRNLEGRGPVTLTMVYIGSARVPGGYSSVQRVIHGCVVVLAYTSRELGKFNNPRSPSESSQPILARDR